MNAILHRGNNLIGLLIRTNNVASATNVRQSMWSCKSRWYSMSFPSVPTALPGGDWAYKGQIPTEIKVKKNERAMYITWDDGKVYRYPAEFLRVESPSAEVQGHGPAGYKKLVWGRKYVNIIGVEPQGNYAVLIKFDDMHDTGIYPWSYLYYLGETKVRLLKNYVFQLRQFKKERDPRKSYK